VTWFGARAGSDASGGFGATVDALGGAVAGTAGDVGAGRDGALDVEGCDGVFDPGSDVTGGFTGVAPRCATVRAGTAAAFDGSDGASRKMTSDRPTNPMATAAAP